MNKIRVVWDNGADTTLPLPAYETPGAAGADLRANLPEDERHLGILLAPMERRIVPTGLRVAIPEGYEIQIRPRSGLALKKGVTLANSPGTIDSDYRGPLGVLLINLGLEPYIVHHGDRIAQAVIAPIEQMKYEHVEDLGKTTRAAGGFGSTGRS